jgi:hypothetical protein
MGHPIQPAKLAMLIVIALPLLLLRYEAGNVCCSIVHENSEDFQALVEFKQGITDTRGALNNWNPETHFCRWYGVCELQFRASISRCESQPHGRKLSWTYLFVSWKPNLFWKRLIYPIIVSMAPYLYLTNSNT